jgi:hypothetical protein
VISFRFNRRVFQHNPPQADSCTAQIFVSLDHLVGAAERRWRDLDAELFCRLEIYYQFELGRLRSGSSEGFSPIRPDIDTLLAAMCPANWYPS